MAALALAAMAFVACRPPGPVVDPAYRAEIEAWRTQRLERLTAEDGWLTLVGLHWLQPGDNRFGSDPANETPLEGKGVPALAGVLSLGEDGSVLLRPAPSAGLTIGGQPAAEHPLRTDRDGQPEILELGSLRFHLIERGGRIALRVKDLDSEARRSFKGIEYYPVDPRLRVEAWFEPFPTPRTVLVDSVIGTPQEMLSPGLLRFFVAGKAQSLLPLLESSDAQELFIIFRDATNGNGTYGAGRFLDAPLPKGGKVVLDFNRAYNPPCAFTPYATCPLPPKESRLAVAITAGEKTPRGGH